jgi:hypothetical protein
MSKRQSKTAGGPLEEEVPLIASDIPDDAAKDKHKQRMLIISFLLLLVVGLGNKIFQKLQTGPMQNYPYFLGLVVTFFYIPLSFAYIWPMILCGSAITKEQRQIPWYKFAVMGILDGIAGLMQSFAVNYIPSGSLIVLLYQAAIPISMVISKLILKVKYAIHNYVGASIVVVGLIVVLVPSFVNPASSSSACGGDSSGGGGPSQALIAIWCAVLIASCIPMTLSSVYKEKALGEVEIDVVYMNGWIAIYQFLVSVALAVPSAYASNLTPQELPKNMMDGAKCYVGINSILVAEGSTCPDDCQMAPLYVTLYLFFNVLYNILIIMILKYGSSNILWLAMTIIVPMANFSFALPFMPSPQPLTVWNDIGLVVIMLGLIIYRFWLLLYGYLEKKPKFRRLFVRDHLSSVNNS